MAFHAQFCAVPVHQQTEVEYAKAVVQMPVRAREMLTVLLATGFDRDLACTHIASEVTARDQVGILAGCPEMTRRPEKRSPPR